MKQTKRQTRYQKWLRSAQWKRIRSAALDYYGHKCSVCSESERLQVHHKTYERVGGMERLSDLRVICRRCHGREHFKQRGNRLHA